MANKRSKGVTSWAWVFILVSAWSFVDYLLHAQRTLKEVGMFLFVVDLLSCIAYIICGTFLLRLKEIGRKAAIYLGIFGIILIPLYLKPMIDNNSSLLSVEDKQAFMKQVKPEDQQKALEAMKIKTKDLAWVSSVIGLIFYLTPLWFFTRPKVKEQFLAQETSA